MKTKPAVGDQVFEGATSYNVVDSVAESLILKPTYGNDYHLYVKHADGHVTRHIDMTDALQAAAVPHVKAQLLANASINKASA